MHISNTSHLLLRSFQAYLCIKEKEMACEAASQGLTCHNTPLSFPGFIHIDAGNESKGVNLETHHSSANHCFDLVRFLVPSETGRYQILTCSDTTSALHVTCDS